MKKLLPYLLALLVLVAGYFGIDLLAYFPEAPDAPPAVSGEILQVHFIDVGQADCILVEFGNFHMLIDGGNRDDGRLVVSYLEQLGIQELDAVVCTHAHEDHVGGLPAVLAVYPTSAIYAPTKTYASNVFDDFLHYADQQGQEIIIPKPGEIMESGPLSVTFLGPVKSYAETNDTSIVCRLEYGDASFLFTGDMEVTAENDMLDHWGDMDWKVDVLKVGHHGSNTSTGYRFLYETDPDYGIIFCEKGNSYGHPHDEPLSRLNHADVTLLRTDEMGTIIAATDGGEITFTWENQSAQPHNAQPGETGFVGNRNSKIFHAPYCDSLPSQKNRVDFDTYQDALDAGFTPCGGCLK